MASPNAYPNAFATGGADIASLVGNWLSGSVLWVDSATGNDANAGTEPELPKATWVNAYAAASAGDLILCASGHSEVVSVAQTLALAGVTTIGLGVGSQRARFTSAVAGVMATVTGAYTRFYSCMFPASTAATTARFAFSTGEAGTLFGCYFEMGANDTVNGITIADNDITIESCDLVVTASRPARGIQITGAVTGTRIKDVLLDGGSFGWSSRAFDVTASATRINCENVRLANRSDFYISNTGTSYQLMGVRPIDNSGSRIVLAS